MQEGIVRALDLDAELLLEQRCDAGEAARAAGEIHGIHGMAGNMAFTMSEMRSKTGFTMGAYWRLSVPRFLSSASS